MFVIIDGQDGQDISPIDQLSNHFLSQEKMKLKNVVQHVREQDVVTSYWKNLTDVTSKRLQKVIKTEWTSKYRFLLLHHHAMAAQQRLIWFSDFRNKACCYTLVTGNIFLFCTVPGIHAWLKVTSILGISHSSYKSQNC